MAFNISQVILRSGHDWSLLQIVSDVVLNPACPLELPGGLQPIGAQRIGHDLVTEQQVKEVNLKRLRTL